MKEYEIKLTPTEIDWARLAAFIDGEGCISIYATSQPGMKNKAYSTQVGVTNTDPRILFWIRATFGGHVYPRELPKKSQHRQSYQWVAQSRKLSAWVLEGCYPYFLSKKEQADIALALYRRVRDAKCRRWKEITPEEDSIRADLVSSLRTVKHIAVLPAEPLN